ncbi:hypothetical protein [Paenibacillus pasadenensis]|uniref:hypothetical protein n=1 Tax=Paenibacillus pasadenensis TaxID=217090 RepID=UPI00040BB2E7|nr:hypothetical protein [Paenibacillus pasadenensis]
MTTLIRRNPGSARSRKKRESLQQKQQQRLEEQLRLQEQQQLEAARRRREQEREKRREAEARLEELRLEELLMREMERMRLAADKKRGKRLWTAEERMAQRAFAAALMETAAAAQAEREAERSGYAEGWMPAAAAAGGRRPGGAGGARTAAAERTSSRAQLELVAKPPAQPHGGGRGRAAGGMAPPGTGGAAEARQGDAAPGALPLGRASAGQLERLAPHVLAAAGSGRRRSRAAQALRRRRGPVRSPCGGEEGRLRLVRPGRPPGKEARGGKPR